LKAHTWRANARILIRTQEFRIKQSQKKPTMASSASSDTLSKLSKAKKWIPDPNTVGGFLAGVVFSALVRLKLLIACCNGCTEFVRFYFQKKKIMFHISNISKYITFVNSSTKEPPFSLKV
jgi:hypothetical protein